MAVEVAFVVEPFRTRKDSAGAGEGGERVEAELGESSGLSSMIPFVLAFPILSSEAIPLGGFVVAAVAVAVAVVVDALDESSSFFSTTIRLGPCQRREGGGRGQRDERCTRYMRRM